jgi:CTP:molybdopterin cytidylyltransferase MocA
MTVAAVVLAAGSGSRFGGQKLLATLRGRPVLAHVVDAARDAGLDPIVVVIPPDGSLDDVDLGPVLRVVNALPHQGLSSSVRLGLGAVGALSGPSGVDAAVILLGDQPRVRPDVIHRLLGEADQPDRPLLVAPRYDHDGAPNPVVARREAWRLADELVGDRGFGPIIDRRPDLVRRVEVQGVNPDIDTREDLDRLADSGQTNGDVS